MDESPLVTTAVLAALGRRDDLAEHLRTVLGQGADPDRHREALLQVLPYAGFPRSLSALLVFDGVLGETKEPEGPTPPRDVLIARGEGVFRRVYGGAADTILANIARAHPSLPEWILGDAYGKVLARPGLDLPTREVLGVALLTALDQPEQLQGHIRGGLRVGASAEQLQEAVEIAAALISPEAGERARERLRREVP